MKNPVLQVTLAFIGVVQVILGIVFIFAPGAFATALGLAMPPGWVAWMFAMFGARALGFAYGMFLAMRNPENHRDWILSMIVIQAIDWLATVYFVLQGAVTPAQVFVAPILPVLLILVLTLRFPWQRGNRAA